MGVATKKQKEAVLQAKRRISGLSQGVDAGERLKATGFSYFKSSEPSAVVRIVREKRFQTSLQWAPYDRKITEQANPKVCVVDGEVVLSEYGTPLAYGRGAHPEQASPNRFSKEILEKLYAVAEELQGVLAENGLDEAPSEAEIIATALDQQASKLHTAANRLFSVVIPDKDDLPAVNPVRVEAWSRSIEGVVQVMKDEAESLRERAVKTLEEEK